MDRRTFVKSTIAAGAGMALAASMGGFVWAKSRAQTIRWQRAISSMETELLGEKVNTFLTYIRNCDPVSVVGYPAITIPAGYSGSGLPIGLQVVTRPWEEHKLFGIAYDFEQASKTRKPPHHG